MRLAHDKPECSCLCYHDDCARLRPHRWCRHWCVVQWVTTNHIFTQDLGKKLSSCLKGRPLRYWGSKRPREDRWEYCLLLHVDPDGDGLGREDWRCVDPCLTDVPGVHFDHDECLVFSFRCCADTLKQDALGWIASILDRSGRTRKATLFGEERLLLDLNQQVHKAGVRACET